MQFAEKEAVELNQQRLERSENGGSFNEISNYLRSNYITNTSGRAEFYDSTVVAGNRYQYRFTNFKGDTLSQSTTSPIFEAKKSGVWREVTKGATQDSLVSFRDQEINLQFYAEGKMYLLSTSTGNFYSYSIADGSFSTLSAFPIKTRFLEHASGVNGKTFYMIIRPDSGDSGSETSWSYNIDTNRWIQISNPPDYVSSQPIRFSYVWYEVRYV